MKWLTPSVLVLRLNIASIGDRNGIGSVSQMIYRTVKAQLILISARLNMKLESLRKLFPMNSRTKFRKWTAIMQPAALMRCKWPVALLLKTDHKERCEGLLSKPCHQVPCDQSQNTRTVRSNHLYIIHCNTHEDEYIFAWMKQAVHIEISIKRVTSWR